MNERRVTREVRVGSVVVGGDNPIIIQSMTATKTQDMVATVALVNKLERAGAGIIRIAVDSKKDADTLREIREQTTANLSVDLQENYRLAKLVAPFVKKFRYNPGHLYHHEKDKKASDKVAFLVEVAEKYGCALRIGVNCGSVDPELAEKYGKDSVDAMVESALMHSDYLESLGFTRYVVSLKDSDPLKVIEANMRFAKICPIVPLHLGVTEAGLPPQGIVKTRFALERLLAQGIGETLRVSLTVPFERKDLEIEAGIRILNNVRLGKNPPEKPNNEGLDIISCPSCSRVENTRFVDLAERVRDTSEYAKEQNIKVVVMGCRVNGPGEAAEGDIGMWCGPHFVNLTVLDQFRGAFNYDEIINQFRNELDNLIELRRGGNHPH